MLLKDFWKSKSLNLLFVLNPTIFYMLVQVQQTEDCKSPAWKTQCICISLHSESLITLIITQSPVITALVPDKFVLFGPSRKGCQIWIQCNLQKWLGSDSLGKLLQKQFWLGSSYYLVAQNKWCYPKKAPVEQVI